MKVKDRMLFSVVLLILFVSCTSKKQDKQAYTESEFHESFIENFDDSTSIVFRYVTGGRGADFTWKMGAKSLTEPNTNVLTFKIDPEDVAGAGRGPEIITNKFTFYGSYAARLKIPDPREIQPNVGAVVGYFTYRIDSIYGQSEIDFEWLIADPEIIYIGTWTGERGKSVRVGRTINMAEGAIYETSFRERDGSNKRYLTGEQNQPEVIEPIDNYDASSQFYTYGFDWYPDRIRWWMLNPTTSDTIVLWDYKGSQIGIPTTHSRYRINFWHTNNWPVNTNPNSIDNPIYPYELEVDWMSYEPMKIIN